MFAPNEGLAIAPPVPVAETTLSLPLPRKRERGQTASVEKKQP